MTSIAYVVRRALPYHRARLNALRETIPHRVAGLQIAESEAAYDDIIPPSRSSVFETLLSEADRATGPLLRRRSLEWFRKRRPDLILGPAPAMAECLGALDYRGENPRVRVIIQDDIWSGSNRLSPLNRLVRRLIGQHCDGILVPSALHAYEYERLGLPADRIFRNVNAIDTEAWGAFANRSFRDREGFVFVGRFVSKKGLDVLLAALNQLRETWGEPVRVIGAGPLLPSLLRHSEDLAFLTVDPPMQGDPLREAVSGARFLIAPSSSDQWGLVVSEAMASGTPVVASSRAGAGLVLIANRVSGYVFESGSPDSLAEALRWAAALDETRWNEVSAEARRAVGGHDTDDFARSVAAALSIDRRKPPAGRLVRMLSSLALKLWSGHGVAG